MSDAGNPAPSRPFRAKQSGVKSDKRAAYKLKKAGVDPKNNPNKRRDPRAFGIASSIRAKKLAGYASLMEQRRQHFVMPSRAVAVPPPLVVAVAGPPGVGKSTVIKSLVKSYSKVNVSDPSGPISITTGKSRRVTFLEVANDMGSMYVLTTKL